MIWLKHVVRTAAETLLPTATFSRLQAIRSRNYQRRFLEREGLLKIGEDFVSRYGYKVLNGPFRGMNYTAPALEGRHMVPKLLGSYELELHPVIKAVQRKSYDRIVDVGCAERYYAVGLAMTTAADVVAFDTEPRERKLCWELAVANNAENKLSLHSWCDGATWIKLATGRTFILADCEGYELNLFDDRTAAHLAQADLLVEAHDSLVPGVTTTLLERFSRSHQVEQIASEKRSADAFPELNYLADKDKRAISEYRTTESRWLYFEARS